MRGILKRSRQIALLVSGGVAACGLVFLWFRFEDLPAVQSYTLMLSLLLVPLATLNKNQLFVLRGMDRVTLGLLFELLIQPIIALTCVALFFLVFADARSPEFAMIGQMVAVVVSIAGVFLVINKVQPAEMKRAAEAFKTKAWLKSAIPFTLIGGAGILNSQTDILMLGWLRTSEEVGIYRVAVQGAVLVAFGLVALDAVIAPHFARLHSQKDMLRLQRLVTLSSRAMFAFALPVVLAFVLAGGKLASWVFGAEFENSHYALAVLSVAHLINASMGSVGYLLNMTGHEKDSANVLMFTALLNVILNAFLIPAYGIEGAAVATAISIVSWKVTLAVLVRKRLGLNSTAFARLS